MLVIELQQRLSNLDTELGTQRDRARQMEARANFLENEKALLTAAEQRLVRMVDSLSTEKHKLSAQLQVEQKVCNSLGAPVALPDISNKLSFIHLARSLSSRIACTCRNLRTRKLVMYPREDASLVRLLDWRASLRLHRGQGWIRTGT